MQAENRRSRVESASTEVTTAKGRKRLSYEKGQRNRGTLQRVARNPLLTLGKDLRVGRLKYWYVGRGGSRVRLRARYVGAGFQLQMVSSAESRGLGGALPARQRSAHLRLQRRGQCDYLVHSVHRSALHVVAFGFPFGHDGTGSGRDDPLLPAVKSGLGCGQPGGGSGTSGRAVALSGHDSCFVYRHFSAPGGGAEPGVGRSQEPQLPDESVG